MLSCGVATSVGKQGEECRESEDLGVTAGGSEGKEPDDVRTGEQSSCACSFEQFS